jgi:hypothetical protein
MTSCNVEFMSGPNHDGYGARIECPPGKCFASSRLRICHSKIPFNHSYLYYYGIFAISSSR